MPATPRSASDNAGKATKVSLDEALLAEARSLRINISRAAEAGPGFEKADNALLIPRLR